MAHVVASLAINKIGSCLPNVDLNVMLSLIMYYHIVRCLALPNLSFIPGTIEDKAQIMPLDGGYLRVKEIEQSTFY